MVRELVHDPILLGGNCRPAVQQDEKIGRDLEDTLLAHRETCVGMAANMIGEKVSIIAFFDGNTPVVMYNPQIIRCKDPYETEESCLSLLGGPRKTTRYRHIKVSYMDAQMRKRLKTYEGFSAQVIQHEVDHCNGILI